MDDNKGAVARQYWSRPFILTIVFVVLKLCDKISWSWWWILSPMWISLILGLLVCVVVGISEACSRRRKKR